LLAIQYGRIASPTDRTHPVCAESTARIVPRRLRQRGNNFQNLTLVDLRLDGTKVSDVSALKDLTTLYLDDTKVSDVSALRDLKNLTNLGLGFTRCAMCRP
jgi:Leucine-rich repeat (LRR) protein